MSRSVKAKTRPTPPKTNQVNLGTGAKGHAFLSEPGTENKRAGSYEKKMERDMAHRLYKYRG